MSERPGVLFGILLALAAGCTAMLLASLVALGSGGIVDVTSAVIAGVSDCFFLATHSTGIPIEALVAMLLALATMLGFARAGAAALRQQRLLRLLPLERCQDEQLLAVARSAGLDTLWLLPARSPSAFCFGLLRPRVVVTRGLIERLEVHERAAAIWHEAHHARMREPLRCLLVRLAATSFVWLPTFAELADRYLLAKELQADRVAASRTSRRALAAALGRVAARPAPAGAVGLGELAGARIDRLADPDAPLAASWSRKRLALTVGAIGAIAAVNQFPLRVDPVACARLRVLVSGIGPHGAAAVVVLCSLAVLAVAITARSRRALR